MKSRVLKIGVTGIAMAFLMISFSLTALAAEKKVFSINLKNEKVLSEKFIHGYASESILIKQGESLNIITDSKDPDFIGVEQTVFWQWDRAAGRGGIERGHTINKIKGVGIFYTRYESTFKVIRKEFPKTETQFSEKHEIIGGIGKFDGITGSYSCHGTKTEKEHTAKCEGELEY